MNIPYMVEVGIGRTNSYYDGVDRVVLLPAMMVEDKYSPMGMREVVLAPAYPRGISPGCMIGGRWFLGAKAMRKQVRVYKDHCECCDSPIYEMELADEQPDEIVIEWTAKNKAAKEAAERAAREAARKARQPINPINPATNPVKAVAQMMALCGDSEEEISQFYDMVRPEGF